MFELAPLLFKFTGLKSNAKQEKIRPPYGYGVEYGGTYLLTLLRSRHRNCPEMQSTHHYVLYSCHFSAFSQKPTWIRNMSKLNTTPAELYLLRSPLILLESLTSLHHQAREKKKKGKKVCGTLSPRPPSSSAQRSPYPTPSPFALCPFTCTKSSLHSASTTSSTPTYPHASPPICFLLLIPSFRPEQKSVGTRMW